MIYDYAFVKKPKDIRKIIQVSAVYQPRLENTAVYDRLLPVFKALYHDNKKSFAALNG